MRSGQGELVVGDSNNSPGQIRFPRAVLFQAAAQCDAGVMQHHPPIVFQNVNPCANHLAFDAGSFMQGKHGAEVFRQLVRAITGRFPASVSRQ
jgi:hypothetical protein